MLAPIAIWIGMPKIQNSKIHAMKRSISYSIVYIFIVIGSLNAGELPHTEAGNSIKYISGCELDFNNDNELDTALLVETMQSEQLIVLMRTKKDLGAYVYFLPRGEPPMHLSCRFGNLIRETLAGKGKKKEEKLYKTLGTYIQLFQPEGSSVAYFWNGKGFTEIWTSD